MNNYTKKWNTTIKNRIFLNKKLKYWPKKCIKCKNILIKHMKKLKNYSSLSIKLKIKFKFPLPI